MTSVWLGIRLAVTPAARLRTALLVLAAALVGVVLLTTLAAGRYELRYSFAYQAEMPRLVLAAVSAVTLPCLVLLATVSRLSAAVRDRRLANLRLIGLTPTQTRLVGAAETGVAAVAGAALGLLAFAALRPVLVDHPLAGRTWDLDFGPSPVDRVAVLVGIPAVVVLAGLLPTRTTSRDPLAVARRADRTPPGWWRLGPLLLGAALCTLVLVQGRRADTEATDRQVVLFFAGAVLLGLGLVLVLPALVRLLTRAVAGRPLGAASRIAVRRLEAQPAAVARIIGALLVGLFLVTGARYVLVAFESTPQYEEAAHGIEDAQRVALSAQEHEAASVTARAASVPGVVSAVDLPTLDSRHGTTALVATCAELAQVAPDLRGCRDGEAMWIGSSISDAGAEGRPTVWRSGDVHRRTILTTPASMPSMGNTNSWEALQPLWADAIIPPDQVGDLPPDATHLMLVVGPPGRDLVDRLDELDLPVYSAADYSEYDFVATMRGIIWTIAAVVLGVGLLALTIATVDRAVQRRKEVAALQLVGVAPRVLRRAQLLETATPLTIGILLAVGLGALGGATFLTIAEGAAMPWTQTWRLATAGVLGGLAVAAVCMLAATPRLRPEEIRAE